MGDTLRPGSREGNINGMEKKKVSLIVKELCPENGKAIEKVPTQ